MAEQLADINNSTLFSALDTICSYLPNLVGSQCSILVHVFGPEIIEYFSYGATPDEICYQIGVCVDDEGKGDICHLFPISNQVSGRTAKGQKPRKFKNSSKTQELLIERETEGRAQQQRRRPVQEIFQKGISDPDTLPWVGVKI